MLKDTLAYRSEFYRPEKGIFARYWYALRDNELVPGKAKFNPLDIRSLLQHLIIYEFCSGTKLRLRLAGTAIAKRRGWYPTHDDLSIPEDVERQSPFIRNLKASVEHPCGYHIVSEERDWSGRRTLVETTGFPLTDQKGEARFIFALSHDCSNEYSSLVGKNQVIEAEWREHQFIDIGAGTPAPLVNEDPTCRSETHRVLDRLTA